jgi:DNA-binding CsgD family transcriptional regulator
MTQLGQPAIDRRQETRPAAFDRRAADRASGWVERRETWLLALAAAAMLGLSFAAEVYQDEEPLTPLVLALELLQLAMPVGGAVACTLLLLRLRAQEEETRLLRADMQAIRVDNLRWREETAEHLRAIGGAIQQQFDSWQLTAAEQEVGRLLLKGFSHKEIARIRKTGEATIRQQAASLYQKAGLSGRAALSAFFLDEILSP